MTSDDRFAGNFASLKILSSTLSSEDLQEAIGLKADRTWKIGAFRGESKIREKLNGVAYDSSLKKCEVAVD